MNIFNRIFFHILLFSSILNATALNLNNEELNYINNNKIKVAMLPDFPPFSFLQNGTQKGFSYDLLKLVSYKSGLKFQVKTNKWPKNLKDFKDNKVDIIDSISFSQSRVPFTSFTLPYHESPLVIFSRKELDSFVGLESLKGKKIGITKNIFYKKDIEKLGLFKIHEYESFQDKLKALAFADVDIIFGHLHSTQNSIKKNGYTNIKALDELKLKNLKKTDLRFGINKKNKILFSIISKSLNSISNKEWERLNSKWLGVHLNSFKTNKSKSIKLTKEEATFVENNQVKCALSTSWAPFKFENSNKPVGIAVDYWNLILKHANIDSTCSKMDNYQNVLESIKNKKFDITIATAITKDKLAYANFSKSYISYPISIATTLDKSFIANTSELENKKVAVVRGYSTYDILKYNYPKINFILVKNTNEALMLVSSGNVFAAVDILPVLSHHIGKYSFSNLKISGTTEFDFDMRIMIRDDYTHLVSVINKSIDLITEEEKNSISKKWTSVKYDKIVDYTLIRNILIVITLIALYFLYKHVLLKKYNEKLEIRIQEEVEKNREKDMHMLHQSRQAQMGEMIAIIAHQWRQPLNAIAATIINVQTHIDLNKFNLKEDKGKDDFTKFTNKEFNNIEVYISSLSETLEDFRNFYKPNKKAEVLNVINPIQTALTLVRSSIKNNNIKLIENYNSSFEICLFKNELIQVFLNLIKNSQDNFKEYNIQNPIISIETKELRDGIQIEFKDNGLGIKDEIIHKIFNPYFSTKDETKGTGLGLYMSKLIIEEHHKGRFYTKDYDQGVGFIIFLPKKK